MVHLHVHTKYSLLDGMMHIEDIATRLEEIGQNTIALTEHGNLYSNVEAISKLGKKGIKVINGCEVYICDDVNIQDPSRKYFHLVLLAKNEQGRQNLNRLVSESTIHKYYRPRIDFQMLQKYHEGLICLSACMAGEISRALMGNDEAEAERVALKYKSLFGEDYYIEFQAHDTVEQQGLNVKLIQLAQRLNIRYVVTCDAHYLRPEDEKYHAVFIQIGTQREAGETYTDCYLQSESDVMAKGHSVSVYIQEAIQTTHEIADKCQNTIPLSAPIVPHVDIPPQYHSELEYLKALCNEGLRTKGLADRTLEQWKEYLSEKIYDAQGNLLEVVELVHFDSLQEIQQIYIERAQYEMNALAAMGFEGYYLLVNSYVNSATRRGIARGSGGGSLLAYLCGIVDIDPIKYGLYFERFIDVGAIELLKNGTITKKELKIPDFDCDFSPTDRDGVLQFIVNKYGEDKVVSMGQFSYLWAKGAIKDIGRVLGIPFEITNEMTKNLNDETIDDALTLGLLDKYKDQYPELFKYASKLSGLPKSFGVHPCFPKDTIVMTDNGYKKIQDINVGDLVLTHTGKYKHVAKTMVNKSNSFTKISGVGFFDIESTLNHPYLVRHRTIVKPREYSSPEWIEAKDIVKSDAICFPLNPNSITPVYKDLPTDNKDFWWIIGRYIGDGWCEYYELPRNEKRVIICCDKNTDDELNEIISKVENIFEYRYIKENTTYKLFIKSDSMFEYLQRFGKYAYGKHLTKDILDLPIGLLESFLDGYLSADGYIDKRGFANVKTVSFELVNGLIQCVGKVYKNTCSTFTLPETYDTIEGRTVHSKEKYVISFKKTHSKQDRCFYDSENNCIWCYVNNNSTFYASGDEIDVYNLSVIDDNSYTANNIAVHNCGKICSPQPAIYYNATEWNENKQTWVLQGDMHSADDLGLVKFDLLGLRTLDVIYDVLGMIGKDYQYIAPHAINMNDPAVWAEFAQGNTDCIFQFESSGMKHMLKDMQCNSIENLSAANALYRPGSKDYIPNYVNRKNGQEPIEYLHDDLIPILKKSYGIIVFQEQLIEIGRLAKLRNPDELRKATAKKKPELMAKIEPELKHGLMERGWSQEQVDTLWDTILQFARYSFNKSHSSAYAITAYITMYLKVHHTAEFFAACINSYEGDIDNIVKTIIEAKRMGVTLKFNDWAHSLPDTQCVNHEVILGINTMKGFGKNVATALCRLGQQQYYTFIDFLYAINESADINKTQLRVLIKLNWLSQFGGSAKLLKMCDIFDKYGHIKQMLKDKCPLPPELIAPFCKETAKQYREIQNKQLLLSLWDKIPNTALPFHTLVHTQQECLGYVSYVNPEINEKLWLVTEMVSYPGKENKPMVTIYQLQTGQMLKLKIAKGNLLVENPFKIYSILVISEGSLKERCRKQKDANGEWHTTQDVIDISLDNYAVAVL